MKFKILNLKVFLSRKLYEQVFAYRERNLTSCVQENP
jgi:hypothetical protein